MKINDFNALQMRRRAAEYQIERADYVGSSFVKINEDGILEFITKGETGIYKQYIQFADINAKDYVTKNYILMRNIKLDCTCPSFLYWGGRYWATQRNAALVEEHRAPKRNISNFTMCKHLENILLNITDDDIMVSINKWLAVKRKAEEEFQKETTKKPNESVEKKDLVGDDKFSLVILSFIDKLEAWYKTYTSTTNDFNLPDGYTNDDIMKDAGIYNEFYKLDSQMQKNIKEELISLDWLKKESTHDDDILVEAHMIEDLIHQYEPVSRFSSDPAGDEIKFKLESIKEELGDERYKILYEEFEDAKLKPLNFYQQCIELYFSLTDVKGDYQKQKTIVYENRDFIKRLRGTKFSEATSVDDLLYHTLRQLKAILIENGYFNEAIK